MHGDDVLAVAPHKQLQWLKTEMEKVFQLKFHELGPEEHLEKEFRILNRVIRWTPHGIEHEADQRHAEAWMW